MAANNAQRLGPALQTPVKTGEPLGRIGTLEVRLARNFKEVKKAQRLRYEVFYEEMSAIADAHTLATHHCPGF